MRNLVLTCIQFFTETELKNKFLTGYKDSFLNCAPLKRAVLSPEKQNYSVLVTPSSISILSSTNALPSLGNRVPPSLLALLPGRLLLSLRISPSLSLSLPSHIKASLSLSLWGIETVNAWGFDVPLLCEPSQSSACARLPSLHHLIILCGGESERL